MATQSEEAELSEQFQEEMDDEFEGESFDEMDEGEMDEGESFEEEEGHTGPNQTGEGYTEEESASSEGGAPAAGSSKRGLRIPNPIAVLNGLRPSQLLLRVRRQGKHLQQVLWRLEDAGKVNARRLVKVAVAAARPALICLIVARTLRTIENGNNPLVRMARLPPNEQMDYYYSNLLGEDWQQQIQQDLVSAMAEVADGYVTDDMVAEKRQLAAIMLRRLEVEEWDKERMRHFYYGLYGLGPWYWDMEERLHNPFFIGARAWNGPIEGWMGKNKTYERDMARPADFRDQVIDAMDDSLGGQLPKRAADALRRREQPSNLDYVLGGRLFSNVVDPIKAREAVAARQAAEVAAQ